MTTTSKIDVADESRHRKRLMSAWNKCLKEHWDEGPRLRLHKAAVKEGHDAYRYLLAICDKESAETAEFIIARTIDRVQSEEFNIADLFFEIRRLSELIANELTEDQAVVGAAEARRILDEFFETVAHETSVIYEYFAERGSQGLIFLDVDGNITYANRSARNLIGEVAPGSGSLTSRLCAADQQEFDSMLASLANDPAISPVQNMFHIEVENGKRCNLAMEASYLDNVTNRSVFCLSLAPTKVLGIDDEVLDNFEHGVVRVDSSKHICYANAAAKKMIGVEDDSMLPVHIYEFFNDAEEREQVDAELAKREEGELSRYEISIKHPAGRKVPLSVVAIPEMNEFGQHIGSIAFMRNLEVEEAKEDFNQIMLASTTWKDRLEGLCHWLFKRIEADIIYIYQYTEDLGHVSAIATLKNNGEEFVTGRRWYVLSRGLIQWNQEPGYKLVEDFPEFLEREDASYLKEDDTVKLLVHEMGIRSFMATSVMEDGPLKAGVSFLSREYDKFNQDEADLIDRVPLENFVMSALKQKKSEEKEFQFRLMAELSACNSFDEIAQKVTSELAGQYKWDNVSIFDVAEDLEKTILMHQTAGPDHSGYELPEGFSQPVDDGLLGRAVRKKSRIYVGNVENDPEFVRGHEQTKSELVIPIFSNLYKPRRIFWLLNIEDSAADFLLDYEIGELEEIAAQIEFIVNRMIDRVTYRHAVEHTSDGLIITDVKGAIRFGNPAAYQLLGYDCGQDLIGRKIEELFCDAQMAENFISGRLSDSHKVELLCAADEPPITVLMSRLELTINISDKYYSFKTLEPQKHLANLDAVERLVSVTANQVKTPLALVQGMLHRLSHSEELISPANVDKFVERSRNLLRKAELSYDRVAYSKPIVDRKNNIETYIHFDRMFDKVSHEISGDVTDVIDLEVTGEPKPISGDRHQIRFVCESLVSYLMRNLAPGEQIHVNLDFGEDRLDIGIDTITDRQILEDHDTNNTDWDRMVSEAAFGRSAITQIVEQHGGEYHDPIIDADAGRLGFRLSFPVSETRMEH